MLTHSQDESRNTATRPSSTGTEESSPPDSGKGVSPATTAGEGRGRRIMFRKLLLPWNLFTALGPLFGVIFIALIPLTMAVCST